MARNRNEDEHTAECYKKLNLKPIFNIAEICHQHDIHDVVLSPGSRCAPLTLAFARHKQLDCKTISDERSAAFVALGMSQQTRKPTVLICTSGSATLNYAPAVAEAYFQQVPLLILTADRPPEWIDQMDGQTIRQTGIYGNHVKKSFQLPADLSHADAQWHCTRVISEAINTSQQFPPGPVHVNIPFREPFYPEKGVEIKYDPQVKVIKQSLPTYDLPKEEWSDLIEIWKSTHKKLIIGGQQDPDTQIIKQLRALSKTQKIPIVGDILSNLHSIEEVIAHADVFLGSEKKGLKESLQPTLVVTFGKSTISKNLKLFLRKFPATVHWHIQQAGDVADTYQSITQIINTSPAKFFTEINATKFAEDFNTQKQENFYHLWVIEERKTRRLIDSFFPQEPLGEFEVVHEVMKAIEDSDLHLANSMAVRYANFQGLEPHKKVTVFSNRGTSGIDGCTSTAVGSSLASKRQTVLITGDMAFFYDRNAFWHNYSLKQLKIIVLNNHAGGIFRIIQGPTEQPELEEYFETRQPLTAKSLAQEFGIHYLKCNKRSKLTNYLKEFFESKGPIILEVESSSSENKTILGQFKEEFRNQ